jgi:hypothetical protein
MFKMGSHDPFGQIKRKLWPKERLGVKLANYRPLKVRNRLDFLACKWRAMKRWKVFHEGYNIALDLALIKGLHTKLWAFKVAGVAI